jgi:hypothetical protein
MCIITHIHLHSSMDYRTGLNTVFSQQGDDHLDVNSNLKYYTHLGTEGKM